MTETLDRERHDLFVSYLPGIRRHWVQEQHGWQTRRARAWEQAQGAAKILRDFGATRVIAFGSLVRTGPFDGQSDIDLAEEGIPASQFFRASAAAAASVRDFHLDIVDLADCQPVLRQTIFKEGSSL